MHVRIGKPKAERPKLEVGVTCQLFYKVETRQTRSSGGTDMRTVTNCIHMFQEWPPFDPGLSEQSFTVRIPEDGPWSYDGKAFGFIWSAVAREKRRFYQSDAGRVAYLEVMP